MSSDVAGLNGAVALVTGARGGIGRAICVALCEAGARVVASGIGNVPKDLPADAWLHHDVTSANDWVRVVEKVRSYFGRFDCLINNAGVATSERIADVSIDQWRRIFSVNVEGVLYGLQASMCLLDESGRTRSGGSSVVNVSSISGLRGAAFNAAYCASKGAVTLLSKAAAKGFAMLGYAIRVNSIHPGGVLTPMMDATLTRYVDLGVAASPSAQRAVFDAKHPLGRMAQPEEIAGGVVFLCSSAASFMTGSELIIDGGATS